MHMVLGVNGDSRYPFGMKIAPRIDEIESFLVDIPTIRPHRLSMTTINVQTILIVRIRTSDGIVGIGEGATIGGMSYGAECPEGMKLTINSFITPVIRDCDPNNVIATMAVINKNVRDNHFAKCAVETALLDAVGKRAGLPIFALFGGRRVDRLPVAWSLASGDTGKDIAEAEEMLDRRRHCAFKVKIGGRKIKDDIAHVSAIKDALGERASVRVDVNQAWSEASAARAIASLEDAGVDLIEQPIARSNRDGMARLARRATVPIMADKSLYGPETAFGLAKASAADVFSVKIAQSGGLLAAARVAAVADAAGIGLYGGTMLESALGTIASAHLFATLPNLEWGTELFGPLLLAEDILTGPLEYSDFSLRVPDGPGLGVSLDEDKLSFFRRDRETRRVHSLISVRAGT